MTMTPPTGTPFGSAHLGPAPQDGARRARCDMGAVELAGQELGQALADLDGVVDALTNRLDVILAPSAPQPGDPGETGLAEPQPPAELVTVLRNRIVEVESIRRRLERLTNRIAL